MQALEEQTAQTNEDSETNYAEQIAQPLSLSLQDSPNGTEFEKSVVGAGK